MTQKTNEQNRPSKFDHPEFLLFLVISFMLWAIGFVDILTHTSENPARAIFGLYSTAVVALLVAHSTLLIGWLILLFAPRSHLRATKFVGGIQSRWWLALVALGGLGALIASLFVVRKWSEYPGLRTSFFFFAMVLALILIFAGWSTRGRGQTWRKLVAIPLLLLVLTEVAAQGLAYGGMLPQKTNIAGLFVPYGRVYQNVEGFANGWSNNYGWHAEDFRLDQESERILLLGDTFVQSLQVPAEESVGAQLQGLMAPNRAEDATKLAAKVLPMGMPGFGPGLYLSETRMADTVEIFQPDEIVLFFHLSNDFQLTTGPAEYELYLEVKEDGTVDTHDESWRYRHDLQHYILHGYQYELDPLKTIASNYLTPKLFGLDGAQAANASPAEVGEMDMPRMHALVREVEFVDSQHADVTEIELIRFPGATNFLFEKEPNARAEEPYAVALGLLKQTAHYLNERDIALRIVTIPAFPKAFFAANTADTWSADLGPYDLLLPEKILSAVAEEENVSFLGLGAYMQAADTSADDIHRLYFDDGQGHFTAAGHQYVADAMARCFYAEASNDPACLYDRE